MTKALTPTLNESQMAIINGKTPSQYIKSRPGRGGKTFDYIETGYVVQTLNEAFNLAWDFDVVDQGIGKTQVWVKGKLTVWFNNEFKVTKTQFGGAEIKVSRDGAVVDLADDLKAAASDALKKCASMLNIGGDVYFPQLDHSETTREPAWIEESSTSTAQSTDTNTCEVCSKPLSEKELQFSKTLCYTHQKTAQ